MGTKLVKRTPKGIELTPEGVALASHVRQLRLSLDDVAREVRDKTLTFPPAARRFIEILKATAKKIAKE